ncbi:hypothetical protein [Wolbachia endosymbiont (group A) of Trypoxylon clavicerum]|nr:hypothetical protein [Wolbachia endosymbiont (group A) of Trypoxylon clavicerum]
MASLKFCPQSLALPLLFFLNHNYMLLAFNLLIIIYPYPITSGLLWKEL